jgi:SecD/SecF fusion protein
MKNKRKGLLSLIVSLAVIVFCGYTTLVGLGKAHKGSAQNIRLGLDLAGGVSITYESVKSNPTDTEMKDTIQKMQQRAEVYSTESSVVQQGSNRIEIDIPGVENAEEVLESLGKEGSLDFVSEDDVTVEDDGSVTYDKDDIICSGSEVKNAEANTTQDETTKNKD